MILSTTFEIDCGEVLAGHHLVATGLRVDGMSDDAVHADYSQHREGKPVHPMVSLTYRITPEIRTADLAGRDVDAAIRLEPPADPDHWPSVMSTGGERDFNPGPDVTYGAFGPFVLPEGTRQVAISLTNDAITTDGAPPHDDGPNRELGELLIDLTSGAVHWKSS